MDCLGKRLTGLTSIVSICVAWNATASRMVAEFLHNEMDNIFFGVRGFRKLVRNILTPSQASNAFGGESFPCNFVPPGHGARPPKFGKTHRVLLPQLL